MSAEWKLRQALLSALRENCDIMAQVNGIFDQGPIKASAPYIALLGSISNDWSSKTFTGREVFISIIWHSAAQEDAPDVSVIDLIEQILANLPANLSANLPANLSANGPQYQIINHQYLRNRSGHDDDGRWSILMDYRFRLQRI